MSLGVREDGQGPLELVVRKADGRGGVEQVRLLEVERMTTDPEEIARASAAAEAGDLLVVDGRSVAVFDVRGVSGEGGDAARTGCLLIGRRGGVEVALLVG